MQASFHTVQNYVACQKYLYERLARIRLSC